MSDEAGGVAVAAAPVHKRPPPQLAEEVATPSPQPADRPKSMTRRYSDPKVAPGNPFASTSPHAAYKPDPVPPPEQQETLPEARAQPPPPQPPPAAEPRKFATLEDGTLIKNRWTIAGKIGQGAFGETYIGRSVQDPSQTVAIKIERPSGAAKHDVLKTEVMALKKLQCPHVVKYLSSGRDDTLEVNYLVMERMGCDVAELKKRTRKATFELGTTVRLGLQMLQAIQSVHENHYIHRDIKPSNFVIGRVDTSKVYLIDFGLARRYRSNDGTVRPARTPAGFRGTARYASIHSHKQIELSRRDDLWCLFYLLVEFRLESGLPWRKHKEKNTIGEMKERFTNEKLVEKLPMQYYLFMKHLFALRYEMQPDYYYLRQLLESIAEESGLSLKAPLEWQREGFEKGSQPQAATALERKDAAAAAAAEAAAAAAAQAEEAAAAAAAAASADYGEGGQQAYEEQAQWQEQEPVENGHGHGHGHAQQRAPPVALVEVPGPAEGAEGVPTGAEPEEQQEYADYYRPGQEPGHGEGGGAGGGVESESDGGGQRGIHEVDVQCPPYEHGAGAGYDAAPHEAADAEDPSLPRSPSGLAAAGNRPPPALVEQGDEAGGSPQHAMSLAAQRYEYNPRTQNPIKHLQHAKNDYHPPAVMPPTAAGNGNHADPPPQEDGKDRATGQEQREDESVASQKDPDKDTAVCGQCCSVM